MRAWVMVVWLGGAGAVLDPVDFISVAPNPGSISEIPGLRSAVQDMVYDQFARASIIANPIALLSDEGYSKQCFPLQIDLDRYNFDVCEFINSTKCPLEPDQYLEAQQTLHNFRQNTISLLMEAKAVVLKQQNLLKSFAREKESRGGFSGPYDPSYDHNQRRERRRVRWRTRRRRRQLEADPVKMGMALWDATALGTSEAALTLVGVNRDAIHDLYSQAAEHAAILEKREMDQSEHMSITQDVADALTAMEAQLRTVARQLETLAMIQELTIPLQQMASEIKMGIEAAVHRGEVTPGLISPGELMKQLRQSYGDLGLRGMIFNYYPELLYRMSRIIVVGSFPRLQRLLGLVCVPMIHSDRLFVLFQVSGDFADGIMVGDKWLIATNLRFYREELPRQRQGGLLSPEGSIVKPVEKPVGIYFIPSGGFLHFGKETFGGVPRGSPDNPPLPRSVHLVLSAGAKARVDREEIVSLSSSVVNATHVIITDPAASLAHFTPPDSVVPLSPTRRTIEAGSEGEGEVDSGTYLFWGLGGLCVVNLISLIALWALFCRHDNDRRLHSFLASAPTESTTVVRNPEHVNGKESGRGREPSIEYILAPITSTHTPTDDAELERRRPRTQRQHSPLETNRSRVSSPTESCQTGSSRDRETRHRCFDRHSNDWH